MSHFLKGDAGRSQIPLSGGCGKECSGLFEPLFLGLESFGVLPYARLCFCKTSV